MAHVVQHLAALERAHPNKCFSHFGKRTQTSSGFATQVAACTSLLTEECGLRCGDRVAIAAINTDVSFQFMLAVLASGGMLTLINWRWSLQDAVEALTPCSPAVLILDADCQKFSALSDRLPSIGHCIDIDQCRLNNRPLILSKLGRQNLTLRAPRNGGAVLCFTSGTTAAPKAAVLSHAALHVQSMSKLLNLGYCMDDVYYHAAPLCHIGGLSSALAVLMAGGTHVFPGRFQAAKMIEDIEKYQVTCTIMVPAMLTALAAASPIGQSHYSVKRLLIGGGTPLPSSIQQCRLMFPEAKIYLSYAMTEACSSMTFTLLASPTSAAQLNCGSDQSRKSDNAFDCSIYESDAVLATSPVTLGDPAICVGFPAAGVEVTIRQLSSLPPGQGVILTRGPHLMSGYWADGGLELFQRPDFWFETGDIGYLDSNGQLWLAGRLKDTIRTGSETVHASEVERCLASHPAVASAAVVGLPDVRFGQQVAALVQLGDLDRNPIEAFATGTLPSVAAEWKHELQAFCKSAGLSGFKVPRVVICQMAPLPMNGSGKILKADVTRIIGGEVAHCKL